MRLMRQFGIIAGMTCVGELMHYFIPLPVPGSIYGLALMMIALMTGMIKLESVLETSQFLIDAMPLMFIPAGVGLMTAWGQLRTIILPVTVVTFVSTVLVMGITGRVTEILLAATARGRAKGETASQELKEEVLAEENVIAEELREAAKHETEKIKHLLHGEVTKSEEPEVTDCAARSESAEAEETAKTEHAAAEATAAHGKKGRKHHGHG